MKRPMLESRRSGFILLTIFHWFFCLSTVYAGNEIGNGGGGRLCYESPSSPSIAANPAFENGGSRSSRHRRIARYYVLDLFEAQHDRSFQVNGVAPSYDLTLTEAQYIENFLVKLRRASPYYAREIEAQLQWMENGHWVPSHPAQDAGQWLNYMEDSHPLIEREGCTRIQLAIYVEAGAQSTVLYDPAQVEQLNPLNKAAIKIHEAVYKAERRYFSVTHSDHARRVVAIGMSRNLQLTPELLSYEGRAVDFSPEHLAYIPLYQLFERETSRVARVADRVALSGSWDLAAVSQGINDHPVFCPGFPETGACSGFWERYRRFPHLRFLSRIRLNGEAGTVHYNIANTSSVEAGDPNQSYVEGPPAYIRQHYVQLQYRYCTPEYWIEHDYGIRSGRRACFQTQDWDGAPVQSDSVMLDLRVDYVKGPRFNEHTDHLWLMEESSQLQCRGFRGEWLICRVSSSRCLGNLGPGISCEEGVFMSLGYFYVFRRVGS